ncbi:hypothetical protein [Methylobacterium gnaphalii]|uniref:Uncharacterized protein n=1 Tax=Methylobacterium gnaphalii TaxID=1010610 RepID=A0A512JME2_9HYPH|nr:hypothetical protein [Methylobacterium gnaphalii]GEP11098.1 hypothetical protein MGN01_29430 [Methylobacterium gnaphalii]GLS50376.1 hypothetical protein GCM10007885_32280 [Methylobacterium gnaphalii]GLS50931.1 hypothetical protein GCM10007885_37850 [Methylobacterium gnaphalii]
MRRGQRPAHPDEIETKKAKADGRSAAARQAWAEVDAALKARDEKTEQLRAVRLAREASVKADKT